jgi:hypothetical protein
MSKKKVTTKKYGVFITSAINAKFSLYDPTERLEQTLETIASVRERIPNAIICLTDCSQPGISDEVKAQLTQNVDHFMDFSGDENVVWIHDNIEIQDVVKNLTELAVVHSFFETAQQEGWFDGCERIFKVSGRYTLTDTFNTADYENDIVGDKYVVSKRMLSQFVPGVTGVDQQHMLRVYSFGANRIGEFILLLEDMTEHMQDRVNAGGYIDIEHLWYKFLPKADVVEFDRTGVKGLVAPNGQAIEN